MFERYAERSRRALFLARYEATQLGNVRIFPKIDGREPVVHQSPNHWWARGMTLLQLISVAWGIDTARLDVPAE